MNFNGRHQTCRSAGARAGVRQRVRCGRGRPKAASGLRARWRLGAVTTFIDISRLQRLCCTLFIIICFLSTLVSRPTARCRKSQFDCCAGGLGGSDRAFAIMLQRLPVKLRLIGYSCVIFSER